MPIFRIEVYPQQEDHLRNRWVSLAHQANIVSLTDCLSVRLFFVEGEITLEQVQQLASEILIDSVVESSAILDTVQIEEVQLLTQEIGATGLQHIIEVTFHAGVTDPVAENLVKAAHRLGIHGLERAATGEQYVLYGELSREMAEHLAQVVFTNPVVQRYEIDHLIAPPFVTPQTGDGFTETIGLTGCADEQLLVISKERRLSLDLAEMQAIQTYYEREGRDPTDIELEMLAQTWSEHCVHKTFKATIDFTNADGQTETIHGLLKTYIRAATDKINKDWVRSAFVDNAGIIAFNDEFDLAFKVETHNHPSALEPFGGANTGVGGVVRDVLGVSARPIANTDVLLFGEQDMPEEAVPAGVLHPRRIADGVIHGVEDYGNKMGIPTVSGAIFYDNQYTANPLVFCGCVGILPHGSHRTQAQVGDLIVVIGGRTGRDGLRGATFSSMEMDTSTSEIASISVQIGHPINEKQVQEVILRARDAGLYTAITDCGAGGLSSAVGEMGKDLGATVELTTVPLKYPGLRPWEIWLSEAQERMVLAVPPAHWEALVKIAQGQDVEAVQIGKFEPTGRLKLHYDGRLVGDMDMAFLHDGIPTRHLKAVWEKPVAAAVEAPHESPVQNNHFKETLLQLLEHPNIRSKEGVIRRYDHEVQGGTVVKPLVGKRSQGHGDGTVIVPLDTKHTGKTVRGFAVGHGLCPQYGELDPYAMAWAAVDEAFRNLVAVGADPDTIALLDNFCWGNPNLEDRLGSLVLAAKGCHDAALAYNAPFISGKDSLNNEYTLADGTRHAIPGTLLISAIGIVPDVTKTVTMDLKQAGNQLYVIGETKNEMGGSHYHRINGIQGGTVPQPNPNALNTMRALHRAIQADLVVSCHDVSEGGIAVALAEMCIAGGLGAYVEESLAAYIPTIFSETTGRFIVEVKESNADAFMQLLAEQFEVAVHDLDQVVYLGYVQEKTRYQDGDGVKIYLEDLEKAWQHRSGDDDGTLRTVPAAMNLKPTNAASPMGTLKVRLTPPKVLVLHANGTNRDRDAALACELAGGEPKIVHVNQLLNGEEVLSDYHMLVIPGGFSYGDDMGAGVLWAQHLRHSLRADLEKFVQEGRPVLGICNGFQVLVKAGLLPFTDFVSGTQRKVTLTYNESGHFECRPVYLQPIPQSTSLFTEGLTELILCPVAHGEGRIMVKDRQVLGSLWSAGLIPLTYCDAAGYPAAYPDNPNGSIWGIAALCNPQGNVMGLMPHPEDHIFPWQHPRYHRGETGKSGLALFKNGIKYA